jgi:hypothetical protein
MKNMQCHQFNDYAGGWMEGERPAEAAVHLRDCPQCRALVTDLEAIRAAAPQMAEDVAPPPHLWPALRARLEDEGLIREESWAGGLLHSFHLPLRPALAGALLAAAVVAAVVVTVEVRTPTNRAVWNQSNERLIATVDLQLGAEQRTLAAPHEHNPAVKAVLQQNLAIVDKSIAMCEKTVREQPENEMARDYLYDAYQQKADLLATMAARGTVAQ